MMNKPADLPTVDALLRQVWESFFGPDDGPAWYAAGLTWEEARDRQRAQFVAQFGEGQGNALADARIPTPSAAFMHHVCAEAMQQVAAAEVRAEQAEAALAQRIARDRRAADERHRIN